LFESLATLLGPVVAGVLLAVSGPAAVFLAASGLSAAATVSFLRIRYESARSPGTEPPRLARQTIDGVATVARDPDLRRLFGLAFAQTYVRGALTVFTVVAAFELLDTKEPGVAVLSAALGVGGILGSFGASLLVGSRHMGRWLVIALALWGAPIALIGALPFPSTAFVLVAIVGLANSVIDIPIYTLPVRLAPDAVLARVFGVLESLVAFGVALGAAVTPALIAIVGVRGALGTTGAILPALALAAWRPLARLDERLKVRDVEIDALRATPLFGLLPVPTLEYLASRLGRKSVPAGAMLFRQGDPGQSVYVIVDGEADIIGDGALVRTAGPGDCVGEIAPLHDIARTATVRARGDLTLFEVQRDAFLDAVGSHRPSRDAAHTLVTGRLADFHPAAPAT
jgi:MFS family permease